MCHQNGDDCSLHHLHLNHLHHQCIAMMHNITDVIRMVIKIMTLLMAMMKIQFFWCIISSPHRAAQKVSCRVWSQARLVQRTSSESSLSGGMKKLQPFMDLAMIIKMVFIRTWGKRKGKLAKSPPILSSHQAPQSDRLQLLIFFLVLH